MGELNSLWVKTIGEIRYYHATDCPHSWKRETEARKKAEAKLEELSLQYKKLGVEPPKVP